MRRSARLIRAGIYDSLGPFPQRNGVPAQLGIAFDDHELERGCSSSTQIDSRESAIRFGP